MLVIQAEGAISLTWEGQGGSMSGTYFLAPTLRPALAPRYLPTLLVWPPHHWRPEDSPGPSKSLRGCGGGALHADSRGPSDSQALSSRPLPQFP